MLRSIGLDDAQALAEVDRALALARRLIDSWWPAIDTVAELLVERGRLGGREVARIALEQPTCPAPALAYHPPRGVWDQKAKV